MPEELSVQHQRIVFDREATAQLYRQTVTAAGADSCGCVSCKNFAMQRDNVFPDAFLGLLQKLGVDPLKEWEAFDYDFDPQTPQRPVLYGGWFLFVGQLIEGSGERPDTQQKAFAHWFTTSFPTGGLPTDINLCAVEFLVQAPWILPQTP